MNETLDIKVKIFYFSFIEQCLEKIGLEHLAVGLKLVYLIYLKGDSSRHTT